MDIESVQRSLCSDAELRVENSSARVLLATTSDESVDRYDSIILQAGWSLSNYRKNPVIMPMHDYGLPPVGRALSVWVEPTPPRLRMRIQFAPTPLGEEMFTLYEGGFMKAFSVGFIPLESRELTDKEVEKLKAKGATFSGRYRPRLYTRSELLETSAVPIPANPSALVDNLKPQDWYTIAKEIRPLAPRYAEAIRRAVEDDAGNRAFKKRVRQSLHELQTSSKSQWEIEQEMLAVAKSIQDNFDSLRLRRDAGFLEECRRMAEAISRRLRS